MEDKVSEQSARATRGSEKGRIVPFIVVGSVCAGLLCLFHYLAPLEIASVTAYAGIVIALGALVCLIKPIWWPGIRRRKVAALAILAGVALVLVGLFWPSGVVRTEALEGRGTDN